MLASVCHRVLDLGLMTSLVVIWPNWVVAQTLEFTCEFDRYVEVAKDWAPSSTFFAFTLMLDTNTGDAFIKGNAGLARVLVHSGSSGLTFIEPVPSGAVHTTTINLADNRAVHSRNTIVGGTNFAPSQYFGSCRSEAP